MIQQEAATPPEATPHSHYMRPLDGLRGFACLVVVVAHISTALNLNFHHALEDIGDVGVLIFSALSGFLMSTLYTGKDYSLDSAGKYMIARFTRIAPAYWIAILTAFAPFMIFHGDFKYQMTPFMTARSLAFMGNQGVFWSIPPEIQFYGFFLLLWFAHDRFRAGNPWWVAATAVVCVGLVATKDLWPGLMLPSKLHIFLTGFLAAFVVRIEALKPYLCSRMGQIMIVGITAAYGYHSLIEMTLFQDLIVAALVGLSIASLSQSSIVTTPLETQAMRLMGAASFSIYLFHDIILQSMDRMGWLAVPPLTLTIAICCLVSIALPVAFHFLAEKPLNLYSRDRAMAVFERLKTMRPFNTFR